MIKYWSDSLGIPHKNGKEISVEELPKKAGNVYKKYYRGYGYLAEKDGTYGIAVDIDFDNDYIGIFNVKDIKGKLNTAIKKAQKTLPEGMEIIYDENYPFALCNITIFVPETILKKYDIPEGKRTKSYASAVDQAEQALASINEELTKPYIDSLEKKRLVIIINGRGGVGKDTLVDCFEKQHKGEIINVSSVDRIKAIAQDLGWRGQKDEKSRKFLADLKKLSVEYNDGPFEYLKEEFLRYKNSLRDDWRYFFAHIREPEEIEKFRSFVESQGIRCKTVLVERGDVGATGNDADDGVSSYKYDTIFDNDGDITEKAKEFEKLMLDFAKI